MQTIQDMLKQARAGKMVSEDDIPPPVAIPASHTVPTSSGRPSATSQTPAEPSVGPAIPTRQAPLPASIEIPRPAVVGAGGQAAAVSPVAKPRTNVQSAGQQPASSGPATGTGINAAQAAFNAPPVQLHTGSASAHRPADTGNLWYFIACSISDYFLTVANPSWLWIAYNMLMCHYETTHSLTVGWVCSFQGSLNHC